MTHDSRRQIIKQKINTAAIPAQTETGIIIKIFVADRRESLDLSNPFKDFQICEMGLVSEKFANQPREILIHSVNDLSPEIVSLLELHGYTPEQIDEVFAADKDEC